MTGKLVLIVLAVMMTACSAKKNNNKNTPINRDKAESKGLVVMMQPEPADAVLTFKVFNRTRQAKKFLKWQTPFEPLLSKYLDIQGENGQEAAYKGPMAKRIMPAPADSYIRLNPGDSLIAHVDLKRAYEIGRPGNYKIAYNGGNVSGLPAPQPVTLLIR